MMIWASTFSQMVEVSMIPKDTTLIRMAMMRMAATMMRRVSISMAKISCLGIQIKHTRKETIGITKRKMMT